MDLVPFLTLVTISGLLLIRQVYLSFDLLTIAFNHAHLNYQQWLNSSVLLYLLLSKILQMHRSEAESQMSSDSVYPSALVSIGLETP